jgi:hypothetical protein
LSFVATAASSRVREAADGRFPAAALGIAVAPVLAAQGGYFPTSWGWSGLLLAWGAVVGALLRPLERPSRLELAFVGALAAFAVWQAATAIWGPGTSAGLEVERTFVYVAAALALVALVGREYTRFLVGGVLVAIVIVSAYALATRLFPNGFNSTNTWLGARLSTPVGYWNGLGIVAGIGVLLALGFAARSVTPFGRAAAGAAVPLIVSTLYFTFSRGAWLSTFVGLVVLFAADRARVRLALVAAPLALIGGLVAWECSRAGALTHVGGTLAAATHDGHRVAAVVLVATILSAYAAFAVGRVRSLPRLVEQVVPWAAVALVALALVAVLVSYGAPWTIARHGYDSFTSKQAASTEVNLNSRLFSLSNNGRLSAWRVAAHAFEAHPLGGIGAGGFEQYWDVRRTDALTIRDAHSLYLETLAETGVVGMLILGAALLAPLAAFRRARTEPLAAFALAAYVVTLVGLLSGGALLVAARREKPVGRWRVLPVAVGSLVGFLALVGLIGNFSLSASAKAAKAGHWSSAASDARRARFLAPWSAQPWAALGRAQAVLGQGADAVESFRTAVSKDPRNAELWVELAKAERGTARTEAFARAIQLNPLDTSIQAIAEQLVAGTARPKP